MAFHGPGPGRPKGSKNKTTLGVEETLASLGVDPIAGMAKFVLGDVPCMMCRGVKLLHYKDDKAVAVGTRGAKSRACHYCFGSGLEPISAELKAKMLSELAQYIAPKRKAVEMSGDVNATLTLADVLRGVKGADEPAS